MSNKSETQKEYDTRSNAENAVKQKDYERNSYSRNMSHSMDQFGKAMFATAIILPSIPIAVELGLFATEISWLSAASGGADFTNQLIFNKGDIKKTNWTSVAASTIFKNPFTQAAVGSSLEASLEDGFNNSILGDKSIKNATKETLLGTMGNKIGETGGKMGAEMFDMGGKSSKFFGATLGEYQGEVISTGATKVTENDK